MERKGHFICTAACLSLWHPLVVAKGVTPSGAKSLSTVKRPDGRSQVAYKGGPLYTFAQDKKPGDMKGNGFKDVGTWRVITVSGNAAASTLPYCGLTKRPAAAFSSIDCSRPSTFTVNWPVAGCASLSSIFVPGT